MRPTNEDKKWMSRALLLSKKAAACGEVPVGAVLVGPQGILAEAYNQREALKSPLGHAETLVLHRAAKKLHSWRLENTTLYVTLEPCAMCAGALMQARVGRVVYGAPAPRQDGLMSLPFVSKLRVTAGVLEAECAGVLQSFFKKKRQDHKDIETNKQYRYRTSVVVVHKNKVLCFRAIDPTSKKSYLFLPGGKIEDQENPEQSAVRETLEETGYKITLLPRLSLRRRYDFEWNGKINHCDTIFFVGELSEKWHEPQPIKDADYHQGVIWIPIKDAEQVFEYHPDILWGVQWGIKRLLRRPKV